MQGMRFTVEFYETEAWMIDKHGSSLLRSPFPRGAGAESGFALSTQILS